jgi:class 3 adenylate cyclase
MTPAAPSGVVTFLFTDVEGSTRRWEADADAVRAALVVHDKVLRTAIEAYDGFLFSHRAMVSWRPSRRRCAQ